MFELDDCTGMLLTIEFEAVMELKTTFEIEVTFKVKICKGMIMLIVPLTGIGLRL